MSDPTIEEDSLISQDDIDKLLSSSSIEEAEEKLSSSDDVAVDELGELSQADIDSLMSSNVSDPNDLPAGDDSEDDDMELISQADIDSLMGASSEEKSSAPDADEDLDEDVEEISQEDIRSLMGGKVQETEPESKAADTDESSPIVEEDPVNPPAQTAVVEEIKAPAPENNTREDEYVIDESETVSVKDALITQETIDGLIKNFDTAAVSEPVILDEESMQVPEPAAESDEQDLQEASPADDIEDFLKPDSDAAVLDFDDKANEDVSQEDIDALLFESDDEEEGDKEEEGEEDILISQDDIDTLLMAADQEDEDVLGDLMDIDIDGSMDDEIEDEDILENDGIGETDEEDDEDQVVLQGDDEEQAEKPKVKKAKKIKEKKIKTGPQWYKSKLVIACVSALIVLGITVPITYFLFFSGGPGKEVQPEPVAKIAAQASRDIAIETVDINIKTPPDVNRTPGNMILRDFVILAPDVSKGMTYITADISIDYADQRAYHEIQNNLSFYRDMIYDSVNKSLVSEKGDQITEADILLIVETALKKALPEQYVDRVSFKSFKAS